MAGEEPHGHGDRSLLDRLNALKPTGISLDRGANLLSSSPLGGVAATAASAADAAPLDSAPETLPAPSAREDALSARLRNLRNKAETSESKAAARPDGPSSEEPSALAAAGAGAVAGKKLSDTQPPRNPTSPSYTSIPRPSQQDVAEIDVFPAVDEAALDELLGELEFDPGEVDDDDEQPIRFSKEDEAKVSALLEKLQKTPGLDQGSDPPSRDGSKKGDDDDDSDGEVMNREVDKILALARDEAELARAAAEREGGGGGEEEEDGAGAEASEVDRQIEPPPSPPPPGPPAAGATADAPEDPFTLPTVPSQLVDPAPEGEGEDENAEQARQSRDFENDIAVRMAALKGLGAGINTDSFGLPAAPTFRPEDRPVAGLFKTPGYTDEDQKTWCIVCLDDATVRCIGCDNDVYCARCWRDMHRGPSAGYDERGHEWVKFHPR